MINSILNIRGRWNLTPMVEKYWRHISLKFHEVKLQQFYHSLIIFHHYLKYAVSKDIKMTGCTQPILSCLHSAIKWATKAHISYRTRVTWPAYPIHEINFGNPTSRRMLFYDFFFQKLRNIIFYTVRSYWHELAKRWKSGTR